MKTYQVALPDEVAAFVDRALAAKLWDSADDLFAYALLQTENEVDARGDTDGLRKAIQLALAQADRGELLDGETVLNRLREKLDAARKQPA